MNYKQIYKAQIDDLFNDQSHSIIKMVIYINKRYEKMPDDFKEASKKLKDYEKNEIITRAYINYEFDKHA
ncbi:hypothetical protein M5C72_02620 [Companilactobacillus allii]|uniref:Uncharacterized protein n=1 Tax=Companilactobacillus allii TaxID=1847728 RepID=A0A1P8Q2K8_9LACO|nr:hypothetical protein [Companilactobacillus allii]APX72057.1 hypothetical protein BTM29_05545 [Companilactobacillus allii]USQ69148.1 hypothetical protein M5C72_02620 [Companilactobacillus allii]